MANKSHEPRICTGWAAVKARRGRLGYYGGDRGTLPAEWVVISTSYSCYVHNGGGIANEVVGGIFEGDGAGAVEGVAVPIDDCAVRVGGIMAAVVLGAEAGDAILGPIFFREEGLRSILCGSLTAT
jgi:hypothetical protein